MKYNINIAKPSFSLYAFSLLHEKNLRMLVLLSGFIFLWAFSAEAQYGYYRGHDSKYPPREGGVSTSTTYYTYRYGYYEHNDCRRFLANYNSFNYLDSIHAKDIKF